MLRFRSDVPATAELVIVGGGIAGAATAFFAARAGLRPLLLEARRALCTLTTSASTGAFRLQFDNLEELELVRESVDLFLNFEAVTGQSDYRAGIRQQGYLWATTSRERAAYQRELVARQHSWGQDDIELLESAEVRARFPYVSGEVIQARYRAGDGFLDPKAVTMGLAAASGAEIVVDCPVLSFAVDDAGVGAVRTTRGDIYADTVVIAAGPFTPSLAAGADVELPARLVARHKVVMADVPEVPPAAPMTIDDDTGAHWRPALAGAYLLFTDPETSPGPPGDDVTPDHRYAERLLDPASPWAVARISPFWADVWANGAAHWMVQSGQYVMTPDHRPLLGPTPIAGLFVNTGYSGHGIMGSPAGSRHLVDVITQKAPGNPFALDREFVERPVDLL